MPHAPSVVHPAPPQIAAAPTGGVRARLPLARSRKSGSRIRRGSGRILRVILAVRCPGVGVLWRPLFPRGRCVPRRCVFLGGCVLRLPLHSPGLALAGVSMLFRPPFGVAVDGRSSMRHRRWSCVRPTGRSRRRREMAMRPCVALRIEGTAAVVAAPVSPDRERDDWQAQPRSV